MLSGTKINCSGFRAILRAAASNIVPMEPATPSTAGHLVLNDYMKHATTNSPVPLSPRLSIVDRFSSQVYPCIFINPKSLNRTCM